MINFKNKKIQIIGTSAILLTTLFAGTSQAGYVDPGSESDPIVTKSYVDKKVSDLSTSLNSKLEKLTSDVEKIKTNSSGGGNQNVSETFKVLELKKGQIIIANEGTEIIVRAGKTQAIVSKAGGLSDITAGTDLIEGEDIKTNHHLMIPRTDGRGIKVTGDIAFVMVKGKYTVN